MSAPTISSTTSILQFLPYESWQYQPVAENDPTPRNCTPLPPGMTFDPATGLISGAATAPGVYVINLTATNGDGTSAALQIAIGIQASNGEAMVDSIDLNWDMETGLVTCPAAAASAGTTLDDGTTEYQTPIAWLKS